MTKHIVIFLFILVTKIAQAISLPENSKFDNRIQYVQYNAGDVVVVKTIAGTGLRIVFAPNETILDVASGFTQGWEFSERRNILYIKAKSIKAEDDQPAIISKSGKWNTNLMVTTNLRLYDFDLHLLPESSKRRDHLNQHLSYRIEFTYPLETATTTLTQKQQTQLKLTAHAAPHNWDYSMQVGDDSENIIPTMAFDDGRFTYLKFPSSRDFPSVFLLMPDNTEVLVNSHVDATMPDTLVVQRVCHKMVLRLGQAVVGIYNDSFDADNAPVEQGTSVLGVKRILKTKENN